MLLAVHRAAAQLDLPWPELPDLASLRAGGFVDHAAAAAAKGAALGALWHGFRRRHLGPEPTVEGATFLAWREGRGAALERFCRFEALAAHFARATGRVEAWWRRPVELRRPHLPEVERLARGELAPLVAERAFLQWLLDRQLGAAQARARAAGMRIGLATDLAVGVTPDSADAWALPEAILRGVSIGAPPDAFAPDGQCWNLAPVSPAALAANGLQPFLGDLEAAMRHAGLVRIDHVMGLSRQFWVPEGARPVEGAYVRFPEARLLAAVAERSRRHRCLVQGEDLGTLPFGFQDRLAAAGFLSSRVLWFERWPSGLFKASDQYPALAVAAVSTHDLPTARGWLAGRDIDWRERVGQLAAEAAAAARAERARDRRMLVDALAFEGLARAGGDAAETVLALHRMLARSRCALLLVQLDDLAGAVDQANLPGTVDEHPNWRRRCPLAVEAIASDPFARALLEAVRAERPG
jgi:4-alpha-glucanotransferase